ncbi:MAG: hypothetical protein GEU82_03160 [Luteitalea sp.]|nr:hypothetical protein [Luteitalea sp.]
MAILGPALRHLPVLVGLVWGVFTYARTGSIWVPLGVAGAGLLSRWWGGRLVPSSPVAGLTLIELSIVTVAAGTAFVTWMTVWTSLWITENAAAMFPGSPDQQKTLAGVLAGGVASYLAALWVKDSESGEGAFWPSTTFRLALRDGFGRAPSPLTRDTREHDAAFLDSVRGQGAEKRFAGWGYEARWKRAHLLNEFLKSARSTVSPVP